MTTSAAIPPRPLASSIEAVPTTSFAPDGSTPSIETTPITAPVTQAAATPPVQPPVPPTAVSAPDYSGRDPWSQFARLQVIAALRAAEKSTATGHAATSDAVQLRSGAASTALDCAPDTGSAGATTPATPLQLQNPAPLSS